MKNNTGKNNSIRKKIKSFAPCAELFPAVVIIHQLDPFMPVYMSSRGLSELGITESELLSMGKDYLSNFFKLEDAEDYLNKLKNLLQKGDSTETFSFFQQVKFKEEEDWVWHIASSRIFELDDKGNPTHIITIANSINEMKHLPTKANRLLKEKHFFNINKEKFENLSRREQEVLKLVAIGKNSRAIADKLCISKLTVNAHRKNIKRKLSISSGYEFVLYAHAFDLI